MKSDTEGRIFVYGQITEAPRRFAGEKCDGADVAK
jgi:hypothetical protein